MYSEKELRSVSLISIIASSVTFETGVFRLMGREAEVGEEHNRRVRNYLMFHFHFVSVAREFRNAYPI